MMSTTPRIRLLLCTGLPVLVGMLLFACRTEGEPAPPPGPPEIASGSVPWRGMSIQLREGPGALDTYLPLVREVAGLGANTLLLSIAGYMEHARSQAIYVDALGTPSREDLLRIIDEAHKCKLRVVIMPIVLLRHPRGSEWRGVIDPPSWDKWWQDYRDFVKYFADVAAEGRAEALIVGSELVSTEKHAEQWEITIHTARAHYPDGMLGYSAN